MIVLIVLAIAMSLPVPDCHVSVRPMFGPDADSPIGVGIDGARVTTKCVF